MMDKSWVNIKNRADPAYIRGIDSFLEWAFNQSETPNVIRCPCRRCMNTLFKTRVMVRTDLLRNGFWDSYMVWYLHGEVRVESHVYECNDQLEEDSSEEDNITEMIHDAYGVPSRVEMNSCEFVEEPNMHAKKFYELLKDAETELYPGCKVSKLSFAVRLLHLKCINQWSNRSVDALLGLFKDVLPNGALVPNSYYEAKKVIRDLGLDYTKIDACENDCILYWREHANAQSCPKCKKSRWESTSPKGKKVPHKVLRYFPIKPRLQRLYMAKNTAKEMRWHKEERVDDGVLRHPADSMAWKAFDERYPDSMTNPDTGEPAPPDQVWEKQHTRRTKEGEKEWADPKSKEIYEQLHELVVQQSQVENPLTSNAMLESVLGRRSGYVRGLGYGAKPPSRRGMSTLEVEARVSSALDTVREQLEEERAKRAEMEKKLQEQYELERARRMEIEHKQLDLQAQVSALMALFNQGQFQPPLPSNIRRSNNEG